MHVHDLVPFGTQAPTHPLSTFFSIILSLVGRHARTSHFLVGFKPPDVLLSMLLIRWAWLWPYSVFWGNVVPPAYLSAGEVGAGNMSCSPHWEQPNIGPIKKSLVLFLHCRSFYTIMFSPITYEVSMSLMTEVHMFTC